VAVVEPVPNTFSACAPFNSKGSIDFVKNGRLYRHMAVTITFEEE
jgi:hypothetical protein